MIGILLLISLSLLFGWAFTEQKNRKIEALKDQLQFKGKELERMKEQHEWEKNVLKNTIRELL